MAGRAADRAGMVADIFIVATLENGSRRVMSRLASLSVCQDVLGAGAACVSCRSRRVSAASAWVRTVWFLSSPD